jgi:hypothetical protein
MTSAELNKQLRKLQSERVQILERENQTCRFIAATTEDPEEVRPEYDLSATDAALAENEQEIRRIKHRLNVFNSTHRIEELGMTIDEVLVFLPQLSDRVKRLGRLAKCTSKTRLGDPYGNRSSLIEYQYANYSLAEAQRLYDQAQNELARAQIALDRVNTTVDIP